MSRYKNSQYIRQEELIKSSNFFSGDEGNGFFKGIPRPFVLRKATRIITLHSYDISNEAKWHDAFEWLMNKALIFKKIAKQFDK